MSDMLDTQSMNPIVAVGTNIVTLQPLENNNGGIIFPKGAVGVVMQSPTTITGDYMVRFPNGRDYPLRRDHFAVQKHFRDVVEELPQEDLFQYVIYRCVVGSRAYGLATDDSDTDRRGIYLPPADMHWSIYSVPDQLNDGEDTYWEIQKFIMLALKANPNILECLNSPMVELSTPIMDEIREQRGIFISRLIYQTYNGYVMSQFRKIMQRISQKKEINWKHAMHLIRLLISGTMALKEGFIPIDMSEHRDQLLAIRNGEVAWSEVNLWRLHLHEEFDHVYENTALPERPDYAAANRLLIMARHSMVE